MRPDPRRAVRRLADWSVMSQCVRRTLRSVGHHDLAASLVVFLVAVPLSLGIAVASSAPVTAGLVAAAVGGIVAGALGGSRWQVSGPAAGLTVVVAGMVSQFGWRTTCALTALAGLVQVGLGLSRVARFALAISPTVVHAMLAGIGVTIALAQLHVLLGGSSRSEPVENLMDLPRQVLGAHDVTAAIGAATIALLLVWPRLGRAGRILPAPLVAVGVMTVLAAATSLDVARVDLPGSPIDAIRLPTLPSGDWAAAVAAVLALAAVASVETLVCAVAVDRLRPGGRTDYDRELIGQGAANTVSGMLGGLPVSGVIVRSSTNVAAGAETRASSVLHGVWVLLFVLLLGGLVEQVPLAVLAALLIVVGLQLVKPAQVLAARAHGELSAYLVTMVGVVVLGLLEGVAAGVAVSLGLMLRRVLRAHVRAEPTATLVAEGAVPAPVHGHWTVVAGGTLSFLSVPHLSRTLAQIPAGSVVALHVVADFLDHAVVDHIRTWKHQHEATGGIVHVDELTLAPRPLR